MIASAASYVSHAAFWSGLFLLGCYHGLNPGMGWLFAVALGLQERSRRTIFAALPPIALGHVASVLAIVALAGIAKAALPQASIKYGAAALLIAFGLYRALRARHLRWVGMRVGPWGLAVWAFLMASGHGAGLMLLPFLLPLNERSPHLMRMPGMTAGAPPLPFGLWLAAVGVHTLGYLATMTAAALVVYDRLGVRILRTAWFNFDLVWAAALVISGCILIFL